jgi:PAS domain S-box-containing protein
MLPLWERTWSVRFIPDYEWLATHDDPRDGFMLAFRLVASPALSRVVHIQHSRYAGIEIAVRDRTAELNRSRAMLDAIVDNSPSAIRCKDTAGRFMLVNRSFCEIYTLSRNQLPGRTDREIYPATDAETFEAQDARVIAGEALPQFENHYRINGREHTFLVWKFPLREVDGTPFAVVGIAIDITALRHAEREQLAIERKLLEVQKPESLGVLAGGIAHDFNNLLTGVLGNAGLLAALLPPAHESQTRVRNIERAATRAAELCRQMLAYAGSSRFVAESVDLASLTREILPLSEMSIGRTADLIVSADGPVRRVMADPAHIRQILINLLINASEALPASGGHISVRV